MECDARNLLFTIVVRCLDKRRRRTGGRQQGLKACIRSANDGLLDCQWVTSPEHDPCPHGDRLD